MLFRDSDRTLLLALILILSEEKEALLAAHPGQTLEEIILDITRKERAL